MNKVVKIGTIIMTIQAVLFILILLVGIFATSSFSFLEFNKADGVSIAAYLLVLSFTVMTAILIVVDYKKEK